MKKIILSVWTVMIFLFFPFNIHAQSCEEIDVLIFHAATAGEYEQLKPILKKINRKKYFIIQSFTSPTIYN